MFICLYFVFLPLLCSAMHQTNVCSEPNTRLVNCPAPCEATCHLTPAGQCTFLCNGSICICKAGFVRNKNRCIHKSNCDTDCPGGNETYSTCKNPCPQTCDSEPSETSSPECLPPYPCPGGCECLPGYVRSRENRCIARDDCCKCICGGPSD